MLTATFGLVGVLLGASIAAWVAWEQDRRRDRDDVRLAARLVAAQFERNVDWLDEAVKATQWEAMPTEGVALDDWREYRTQLARGMSAESWDSASLSARRTHLVQRRQDAVAKAKSGDSARASDLSGNDRSLLGDALEATREALPHLRAAASRRS